MTSIWADQFDLDEDYEEESGIIGAGGISITSAGPRVIRRTSARRISSNRLFPTVKTTRLT
jgi:hypothetical protein